MSLDEHNRFFNQGDPDSKIRKYQKTIREMEADGHSQSEILGAVNDKEIEKQKRLYLYICVPCALLIGALAVLANL